MVLLAAFVLSQVLFEGLKILQARAGQTEYTTAMHWNDMWSIALSIKWAEIIVILAPSLILIFIHFVFGRLPTIPNQFYTEGEGYHEKWSL